MSIIKVIIIIPIIWALLWIFYMIGLSTQNKSYIFLKKYVPDGLLLIIVLGPVVIEFVILVVYVLSHYKT